MNICNPRTITTSVSHDQRWNPDYTSFSGCAFPVDSQQPEHAFQTSIFLVNPPLQIVHWMYVGRLQIEISLMTDIRYHRWSQLTLFSSVFLFRKQLRKVAPREVITILSSYTVALSGKLHVHIALYEKIKLKTVQQQTIHFKYKLGTIVHRQSDLWTSLPREKMIKAEHCECIYIILLSPSVLQSNPILDELVALVKTWLPQNNLKGSLVASLSFRCWTMGRQCIVAVVTVDGKARMMSLYSPHLEMSIYLLQK